MSSWLNPNSVQDLFAITADNIESRPILYGWYNGNIARIDFDAEIAMSILFIYQISLTETVAFAVAPYDEDYLNVDFNKLIDWYFWTGE